MPVRHHIVRSILVVLLAPVFAGCAQHAAVETERPSWLDALSEPVSRVEPGPLPASSAPVNTAALEPSQRVELRGRPASLTGPIEAPRRSGPGAPARRSGEEQVIRSRLEHMYSGDAGASVERSLTQFGYESFQQDTTPDDSGPAPDDYVLGPGDEIMVSIWGGDDVRHELTVNERGSIVIPEIGALPVAGLEYAALDGVVRSALARVRRDFEVAVSLTRVRRVQVRVTGQVAQPGLIELPARSSMIDALSGAGGPLKSGSLRRVRLLRAETVDTIDLYAFLRGERGASSLSVRDGDTLHVPPIGKTIGVAGDVQSPAIYELLDESATVSSALELAGGLTPFAFTARAQIERTREGRGREAVDVELDVSGMNAALSDGDLLLIGSVDRSLNPRIEIVGAVVRPGRYQHREGLRLAEVIDLADGLTVSAYLPQALISRQVGETDSVESVHDRTALETSRRVLVVDLRHALMGHPDHDVIIEPLDRIEIRTIQDAIDLPAVTIMGAVRRPGDYELTAGQRVSDLVAIAGNLTADVFYEEAELIRKVYNPSTLQLEVRRHRFNLGAALDGDPANDPVLEREDRVVIRRMGHIEVRARIEGQVRFPGEYVFPAGARISDLIAAAGGVLGSADMRAAEFTRVSVRRLQQERYEHLEEQTRRAYESALESMVQTGQTREGTAAGIALEQTEDLMQRMAEIDANGRVVVPFLRPDFPTSEANLALETGDTLTVPRRQETVSIVGHVFNPSSFVASPGITVGDVLDNAGGLTENADDERIYVVRADGSVESMQQRRGLKMSTSLLAGDVVLVPRAPLERTFGAKLSDTIFMARQAAEAALLWSQVPSSSSGSVDVTTVLEPSGQRSSSGYDPAVLQKMMRSDGDGR